jgi:ABC-type sugar transport system substrate-binding protein
MRATARLLVSSAFLSAVTIGCSGGEPAAPSRPVVALVMKSLANEFFQTME